MDNATYDELNLTPITTDETYSRLRTNETKIKPSYELQRGAGKMQQKKHSRSIHQTIPYLTISLTSIALSVTIINRLTSEQSKLLNQLDKSNADIKSAITGQFDTIEKNLSQNVMDYSSKQYVPEP